jgi:hypothetical protein
LVRLLTIASPGVQMPKLNCWWSNTACMLDEQTSMMQNVN